MHGGMDYMARRRETREDVTRWFPRARSVVLCAFSYHDGREPVSEPSAGRLARYALPLDYHDELEDRMRGLLAWYEAHVPRPEPLASRGSPPARGRVFVDSSPVLERLYARYAGIGWVGKNTLVLSKDIGSFFLLAGLAVDAELAADEPVPEHCGTCRRCLDACPTGAFPEPRVLDATRCVAYFTVEAKDVPVPEGFREGVGDWVFGCDACQDICPFNRFATAASVFTPRLDASQDLEELASLDERDFERRFSGTPLARTGRRALARNALLAMGNSGDPRFIPALERHAAGPDPLLAEQARWSLERLRRPALENQI